MIAIIAMLMTAPAAAAQLVDWSHGYCFENGIYWPQRSAGYCVEDDKRIAAQTFPPPGYTGVMKGASGVVSTATVTNSMVNPRCPADRTVVVIGDGTPKCAKDLTDPE